MNTDLSRASWRCVDGADLARGGQVEIAFIGDAVAVRNSDGPDGPIVIYTRREWEAFILGVREGQFSD